MNKICLILFTAVTLSAQAVLADDQDMASANSNSKPCAAIAKACIQGGFVRKAEPKKKFWQGCMKPILLGEAVKGVTVDTGVVKECRTNKIAELEKELKELQKAAS